MALLSRSGSDRLLCNSFHGRAIATSRVPVCANLQGKRDHHSSNVGRILSRGGLGGVRESTFRVECSETQTIASVQATEDPKIVCEACRGLGFRICDYCEGEKVNVPVKGRNNRFHRRCPECKAVGIMMCYKCKVFKCVTFPDWDDGSLEKKK
ncbi:hypothetical protein R1flu_002859 [Riccia fluitans]|uniref:Uncharacterized protein n=1 Tax=Riccia fluitans TaxID=41844 RepID=A0ABD1YB37_9MARC